MRVTFQIYKRDGAKASRGILQYKSSERRGSLSDDHLDSDGYAETHWTSVWNGASVDVYCHTDGSSVGTPARAGTVTIRDGAHYELRCR